MDTNYNELGIKAFQEKRYEDAEKFTPNDCDDVDGILVPGGFGSRGVEGKIAAVTYAREHNVPFMGICLGMQVSVIEFMRNVVGVEDANSTEFSPYVHRLRLSASP